MSVFVYLGGFKTPSSSKASFFSSSEWDRGLGLDWNLRGRLKTPSRRGEVQPEGITLWGSWNLEWYCVMWQAAAPSLLDCASQAIRSAKCQGNFFTVFHMQRGKEGGEKKPHAVLRQGRRQTGPPSSGCACQGFNLSDVFLCSPFGGLLWIQKPEPPQTADTCSSSEYTAGKKTK